MNIFVLLSVAVVCCTAAVPLLSWDGRQKETLESAWANGSSSGDAIARPRDKRQAAAVGMWVGSKVLEAILRPLTQMGMKKVTHYLMPTAHSVTAKVHRISYELKDISQKLQDSKYLVMSQYAEGHLECLDSIKYYADMFANEMDGSNEKLLSAVLDYRPEEGIHWQLYKLNELINGESTFSDSFSGAYEPFLVKLLKMHTHDRDMKNFVPKKPYVSLRELMIENVIPKLIEYQEIGFEIEKKATKLMLQMDSTNVPVINSTLAILDREHETRVKQQTKFISDLLKDCPGISLPQQKWLECTDGFRFGSICTQVCNSSGGFPNKGYEPVQCLWNGEWSKNTNGETRLMCTIVRQPWRSKLGYFRKSDIRCKHGNCDTAIHALQGFKPWCYAEDGSGWDYCMPTIRPGYLWKDPSKKCKTVCMNVVAYTGWCYTDDTYDDWEYCMPELVSGQKERTFKGEDCTDTCDTNNKLTVLGGYTWCHTRSGWDYCAANKKTWGVISINL